MLHPQVGHIYRDMQCKNTNEGLYKVNEIIEEFELENQFIILEQLSDSSEELAGTLWIIGLDEMGKRIILQEDVKVGDNWYKKNEEIYRFMLIQ
jgi:hypothetical protein